MSAIFGIINKNGQPVEAITVSKIQQAIAYRATDGSGLWQNENAALGFCKLIVYPQHIKEHLPIESGDIILTADARIDNREQLYGLLDLDKQQWSSEPDTYLILKAYQRWQEKCVDYLEGEYVFVIWNKVSKTLFMVTDHIGFRQIYYYDSPEQFIFCSEIKGIVAVKSTPNYFNEEHLIEYHFKQSPANETYNKEIFALCGGNTLTLKNNQLNIKKYWVPKPLGKYGFTKDEEWIDCFRDLFYKAIEKRLNPDMPVGITLSGGLDSTAIACILSQLLARKNKPLYAFSSVLPVNHTGIEQDERKYIEIVNRHCPNIIQTYIEAAGVEPFKNVKQAFELFERIPYSFFYTDIALLEAAKEKNVRSLFTGFGGDFWVSWRCKRLVYQLVNQNNIKQAWHLLKQLSYTENESLFYLFRTEYFVHTSLYPYIRKIIKGNKLNWQLHTALKDSFVKRTNYKKHKPILSQTASMFEFIETGKMGMCAGMINNINAFYNIQSFTPMFDKDVNEFLAEVPLDMFMYKGHKRSLLRYAMEGIIPKEIQWRKDKLPFAPGYHRKVLQNKNVVDEIIHSSEYDFIFKKYISKETILNHFDTIQPHAGFVQSENIVGLRISQAIISSIVLNGLKKEGYWFEGIQDK